MIISLALALVVQDAAATPPAPPPRRPCSTSAHTTFDFWAGEWIVTPNRENVEPVGKSRIRLVATGCAILEEWMPDSGNWGVSVTALQADGRWHQRWVGGTGTTVDFVGESPGRGQMVLEGRWPGAAGPGTNPLIRMTYTQRGDGSVRQHGEQSLDEGTTWSDSFDFIYRRVPPPRVVTVPSKPLPKAKVDYPLPEKADEN